MDRTGMEMRCLPSFPISSPREMNLRRSSRMRPLTILRNRWWSFSILRTMALRLYAVDRSPERKFGLRSFRLAAEQSSDVDKQVPRAAGLFAPTDAYFARV